MECRASLRLDFLRHPEVHHNHDQDYDHDDDHIEDDHPEDHHDDDPEHDYDDMRMATLRTVMMIHDDDGDIYGKPNQLDRNIDRLIDPAVAQT